MRVSVIGSGYVGLVTGAGLAEKGHRVACVDADAGKIAQIRRGVPPFHEAGLEELLRRNGARLEATTNLRQAVLESDLSFIAVGTPALNGQIDLSAVRAVSCQIGDRKSTRLNSSHSQISYAVFCLKKKTQNSSAHYTHEV